MENFMTLGRGENAKYTRLRCFDLWKLHSWAGGLTEFADGRNQESTKDDLVYPKDFTSQNRVVGVLWANKRDSGLWFAPPEWKECRLGIQVLPLSPITEALFLNVGFVKQLVDWTLPALEREGIGEGWKGFVYEIEGVCDKHIALEKIRSLNAHDDGNSLRIFRFRPRWMYIVANERVKNDPGGYPVALPALIKIGGAIYFELRRTLIKL
nr:probable endo-1,3(4)-beta-glucanase [Tanacetum cinerariifolium]